MESGDTAEVTHNAWETSGMVVDPAAYYAYMANASQPMGFAGRDGTEENAYVGTSGTETAAAAFAAADGGGGGYAWATAGTPGMEDAYRAQLEQYYCQYYQNYYSMMLTAKMAEVETWYTAAVAPEDLQAMEKEEKKETAEIETEPNDVHDVGMGETSEGGNGSGDSPRHESVDQKAQSPTRKETDYNETIGCSQDIADRVSVPSTADQQTEAMTECESLGEVKEGEQGGALVQANACATMEEYYEKLSEYYRSYYEKFYGDWFQKELKQHRRNVALERQRELERRREERTRELGLGDSKTITPEEFLAQQALFNKKNSRFQKEDSAGHWASKGLADDRDGRMMSIYFDPQSYQEQMNALKEKRERKGLEFRAIKKKKHSTKYWKKLKEEKKRQKAAEWLLKD